MVIKNIKVRNFGFLLYFDLIFNDWKEKLESLGVFMVVSFLYDMDEKKDKDIWNSSDVIWNGKYYKKLYYYVIYIVWNFVIIESVRNKIKWKLGNSLVVYVEIFDYIKGLYEYLIYELKDVIVKNKYIYDKKDILNINDFDIDCYIIFDES